VPGFLPAARQVQYRFLPTPLGRPHQLAVYDDCIKHHSSGHSWLGGFQARVGSHPRLAGVAARPTIGRHAAGPVGGGRHHRPPQTTTDHHRPQCGPSPCAPNLRLQGSWMPTSSSSSVTARLTSCLCSSGGLPSPGQPPGWANHWAFLHQGAPAPRRPARYEAYGGLVVSWRWFGSSGHVAAPPGLVLESFTSCQPELHDHVKSLVRTDHVASVSGNSHAFLYQPGYYAGGCGGGGAAG
jgi:hypothetical protein